MEILLIHYEDSNMQRDSPALFCTVCPQLSSLGLHSTGASNADSFHDSASSTVYSASPSVVPAQMFDRSSSKTDEGTDGVKRTKPNKKTFWDALTKYRWHGSQPRWQHIQKKYTMVWMNNHDVQGLLGQEKNSRFTVFLRQLQVSSKNGEE